MSGRYPIHTGLQHGVIGPTSPVHFFIFCIHFFGFFSFILYLCVCVYQQYGLPLSLSIIPQDLKKAGYDTHMTVIFFTPYKK